MKIFTTIVNIHGFISSIRTRYRGSRYLVLLQRMIFVFLAWMTLGIYTSQPLCAQICSCTIHVTAIDTNAYTIGPGQVLCIDSGSVYSGKISLGGGEVCINGTANPSSIVFIQSTISGSSGKITVNRHGSLSTRSNFSLGKISLLINPKGAVNISGDLTLQVAGSTINNQGSLNIQKKLQINSGCSITNTGNINYLTVQNNGTVSGNGNLISITETIQQQ